MSQAGDQFGWSVAVSGDTVVVGAYLEDSSSFGVNSTPNEGAADSGAAYVFSLPDSGTSGGSKAEMTIPASGATLSGASVTFTWSAGSGAVAYWLDVGSAQGQGNIFGQNVALRHPHKIHIGKKIGCTEYCHEAVTKGPRAGLPSLNTCMICHSAIATDKPRIQTITAMSDKGVDIQWQRVYGFTQQAHVRFNHAPHIRANVECSTCHGDVGKGTVATRAVDLNMGFCVNCHRQKNAPNECITCHF